MFALCQCGSWSRACALSAGGMARAPPKYGGAQGIGPSYDERYRCVNHGARGEARACQNRKKQIRHKLHILGGREVAQPTVFKGIPMTDATNARIILKLIIVFVKHLKCS